MVDPSMSPRPEDPAAKPERFLIDNPVTLRAIAHPLRQQILFELTERDSARAADLAKALGEPANSISFHLRTLARAGLIIEAPELARDRRDRVWRRAAEGFEIDRKLPGASAVVAPILDWLQKSINSEPDDRTHGEFGAGPVLLTKEEARQLGTELGEVFSRWQERVANTAAHDEPATERIRYQVLYAVGPRHLDPAGPSARTASTPM